MVWGCPGLRECRHLVGTLLAMGAPLLDHPESDQSSEPAYHQQLQRLPIDLENRHETDTRIATSLVPYLYPAGTLLGTLLGAYKYPTGCPLVSYWLPTGTLL